jgi:hypothetical protein
VTLIIGIRYLGGPAPGNNPQLRAGTVELKRAGTVVASGHIPDGRRVALQAAPGTYEAVASSGDARCIAQSLVVTGPKPTDVTVMCSVK